MKKVSYILIIALIVSSFVGCRMRSNTDDLDNDGLADILNPANEDKEIGPSEGLTLEDSTELSESVEYNSDSSKNIEQSTLSQTDTEVYSEKSDQKNEEPQTEYEINTEHTPETSDSNESESNLIPSEEHTEYSESINESSEAYTTPEPEEELYDGMELELPESKELINEAYTAGMMLSGYPVAKGSGRVILVDKDNPNLIQVVFETYDENILIGVNYHRTNENAKWKLINGASISIIDLTKNEE